MVRSAFPLFAALFLVGVSSPARAATTVETATLGPTGLTNPGGVGINANWFGFVVDIDQPTVVSSVAAHLLGTNGSTLLAAIMPLDPITGLPPCDDVSCAEDFVVFAHPSPSERIEISLNTPLQPGSYGIMFGSYSGGAAGAALAPTNSSVIGNPTWINRVGSQGSFTWNQLQANVGVYFAITYGVCGDGTTDPGEACDDGNADDSDACVGQCVAASCGDGYLQAGVEVCDDGNEDDTDACVAGCVAASCGDGYVQAGIEGCDDANDDDTDACVAGCVVASCGDGYVHTGIEVCDDGNLDDTDACVGSCVLATCGDGFVEAQVEVCDDGNRDNSDSCVGACEEARCGDGFVQAGLEECDDGKAGSRACSSSCTAIGGSSTGGAESSTGGAESTGGEGTTGESSSSGSATSDDPQLTTSDATTGAQMPSTTDAAEAGTEAGSSSDGSTGTGEQNGSSSAGDDVSGCSCRQGRTEAPGLAVFGLLGLLAVRRRRLRRAD